MAIKMLMEEEVGGYLTDEELLEEKDRLLKLLKEVNDDRKKN